MLESEQLIECGFQFVHYRCRLEIHLVEYTIFTKCYAWNNVRSMNKRLLDETLPLSHHNLQYLTIGKVSLSETTHNNCQQISRRMRGCEEVIDTLGVDRTVTPETECFSHHRCQKTRLVNHEPGCNFGEHSGEAESIGCEESDRAKGGYSMGVIAEYIVLGLAQLEVRRMTYADREISCQIFPER